MKRNLKQTHESAKKEGSLMARQTQNKWPLSSNQLTRSYSSSFNLIRKEQHKRYSRKHMAPISTTYIAEQSHSLLGSNSQEQEQRVTSGILS
jgi:hypothetical protein